MEPAPHTMPAPRGLLSLAPLFAPDSITARRVLEFFTANIRNPHTRRAYLGAIRQFTAWCTARGIERLEHIQPVHVAGYIEEGCRLHSAPTVKQHLAALRMLFDWLVTGQVLPLNPAHAVRGPRHTQTKGRTPVLTAEEARLLLDSIETGSLTGLRDRALIAVMIFTFARVSAVLGMTAGDYFIQGRRRWVRLREKNGKLQEMPANHHLEKCLDEYVAAAGLGAGRLIPLFPSVEGRTGRLSLRPLSQQDVHRMIRRRARAAGIQTAIGCHTFRATGITAYLRNGGRLEVAQQMAGHASARTTGLYDRRGDDISLEEVERIAI